MDDQLYTKAKEELNITEPIIHKDHRSNLSSTYPDAKLYSRFRINRILRKGFQRIQDQLVRQISPRRAMIRIAVRLAIIALAWITLGTVAYALYKRGFFDTIIDNEGQKVVRIWSMLMDTEPAELKELTWMPDGWSEKGRDEFDGDLSKITYIDYEHPDYPDRFLTLEIEAMKVDGVVSHEEANDDSYEKVINGITFVFGFNFELPFITWEDSEAKYNLYTDAYADHEVLEQIVKKNIKKK